MHVEKGLRTKSGANAELLPAALLEPSKAGAHRGPRGDTGLCVTRRQRGGRSQPEGTARLEAQGRRNGQAPQATGTVSCANLTVGQEASAELSQVIITGETSQAQSVEGDRGEEQSLTLSEQETEGEEAA